MRFYAPLLPTDAYQELLEELEWLLERLVPICQWDRYRTVALTPFLARFSERYDLNALAEKDEAGRDAVFQELAGPLQSFRFNRLLLGLASWLGEQGWRELMDLPQRRALDRDAKEHIVGILNRIHYQAQQDGHHFARLDEKQRAHLLAEIEQLFQAHTFFAPVLLMGDAKKGKVKTDKKGKKGKRAERLKSESRAYQEGLVALMDGLAHRDESSAIQERFDALVSEEASPREYMLFQGWHGAQDAGEGPDEQGLLKQLLRHRAYWN